MFFKSEQFQHIRMESLIEMTEHPSYGMGHIVGLHDSQ